MGTIELTVDVGDDYATIDLSLVPRLPANYETLGVLPVHW